MCETLPTQYLCNNNNSTAIFLTLLVPSLLVPIPYTKGGGAARSPAISKTLAPMNLKFCRVLETSFKILEMLKGMEILINPTRARKSGLESLETYRGYSWKFQQGGSFHYRREFRIWINAISGLLETSAFF